MDDRTIPEVICTEEYVGPDRRAYRKTLEQVEAHFDLKLHDHEEREMAQIRGLLGTMLAGIMQAFPDGVEAHRAAHQAMIDAKKAEEAFWDTAKEVALKKRDRRHLCRVALGVYSGRGRAGIQIGYRPHGGKIAGGAAVSALNILLSVVAVALPAAFCFGLVRIVHNWIEYSDHE